MRQLRVFKCGSMERLGTFNTTTNSEALLWFMQMVFYNINIIVKLVLYSYSSRNIMQYLQEMTQAEQEELLLLLSALAK